MPQCLFCDTPIEDWGLGWYEHVENDQVCWDLWVNWVERIKQDRPDG